MKKVLVGSRADYDYFGDDYYRDISNSDYDYLVNLPNKDFAELVLKEKMSGGRRAEYHNVNGHKGLEQFHSNSGEIATPRIPLYTQT